MATKCPSSVSTSENATVVGDWRIAELSADCEACEGCGLAAAPFPSTGEHSCPNVSTLLWPSDCGVFKVERIGNTRSLGLGGE